MHVVKADPKLSQISRVNFSNYANTVLKNYAYYSIDGSDRFLYIIATMRIKWAARTMTEGGNGAP